MRYHVVNDGRGCQLSVALAFAAQRVMSEENCTRDLPAAAISAAGGIWSVIALATLPWRLELQALGGLRHENGLRVMPRRARLLECAQSGATHARSCQARILEWCDVRRRTGN